MSNRGRGSQRSSLSRTPASALYGARLVSLSGNPNTSRINPRKAAATELSQWDLDNLPPLTEAERNEVDVLTEHLTQPDDEDWLDVPEASPSPPQHDRTNKPRKRKKYERVQRILNFGDRRSVILDEMIRDESGGYSSGSLRACAECTDAHGIYRCSDCFASTAVCEACLLKRHSLLPFHRVQTWTGRFFKRISLTSLGLTIPLKHDAISSCTLHPSPTTITILHTNGIHQVKFLFCSCHDRKEPWIQLLRHRLWPCSYLKPQTTITFDCLDTFHRLTLQGKLTMYDYYHTLVRMTDNSGVKLVKSRYDEFTLASQFWRHIKSLKRSSVGHLITAIEDTPSGFLALECPACPQPGKNLPDGWEIAFKQWLYTLFVSVDANFRLKLKNNKLDDLSLLGDWGYFVDKEKYKAYVKQHVDEIEPNFCDSNLHAIDHANKNVRTYSVSGVGACKCARHTMVRPNGVGDLTKGEKYCCMDYITFRSLSHTQQILRILISYDIACQWVKNLVLRMSQYPDETKPSNLLQILRACIPDFHICGHGCSCHSILGFMRRTEVGRTCGEGIETEWAVINQVCTSIREMSPSHRQEILNDHWSYWNWGKTIKFVSFLFQKLESAIYIRDKQKLMFEQFTDVFKPALITKWTKLITDWDAAVEEWQRLGHVTNALPKIIDPYREPLEATSYIATQEALVLEEEEETANGIHQGFKSMTRARCLTTGLEIEERQRELLFYINQTSANRNTPLAKHSKLRLQERRAKLRVRIESWRPAQRHYMPIVDQLLAEWDTSKELSENPKPTSESTDTFAAKTTTTESIPLFLPSTLSLDQRATCPPALADVELRLRIGQAEAAIQDMKGQLRDRQLVFTYKKTHVSGTGQGANTRVRSLIESHSRRIAKAARRYRVARQSIISLQPEHPCLQKILPLRNEDVVFPKAGPTDRALEKELREGRIRAEAGANESKRDVSWIWLTGQEISSPETLRVEWSKNRARYHRWREEAELLVEEMRRVIAYFRWKAGDWRSKTEIRSHCGKLDPILSCGLQAYAERQARMFDDMAISCARRWLPLLREHFIPSQWAEDLVVGEVIAKRTGRGYNRKKSNKMGDAGGGDGEDDEEVDEAWEDILMKEGDDGDAKDDEMDAEDKDAEDKDDSDPEAEIEEPLV